nr:MAG TPA: hypothetical protein [Caudoviricetes sp.]
MLEALGLDLNQDLGAIAVLVALVLGFIEKSGIKWNPYSSILKAIGRGINSEMLEKVKNIETGLSNIKQDVDGLKKEIKETNIVSCRTQFTRFGDELRHGEKHSKDHYDQTLLNITKYEQYCEAHKEFANDVTEATARLIKEDYQNRLETNDFLE